MTVVAKKQKRKTRHVPQRTCVGCRAVSEKRSLVRIVRTPEGVFVDQTGKLAGRGAYLHDSRSCWERGMKGSLAGALRVVLARDDLERLQEYIQTLPDERSDSQETT
jgi:uncharacterized protein